MKTENGSRRNLWNLPLSYGSFACLRHDSAVFSLPHPRGQVFSLHSERARSSIGQSTRLRIWGLGVRISPGAPFFSTKSAAYFLSRNWPSPTSVQGLDTEVTPHAEESQKFFCREFYESFFRDRLLIFQH
jgi:hypothetical protein